MSFGPGHDFRTLRQLHSAYLPSLDSRTGLGRIDTPPEINKIFPMDVMATVESVYRADWGKIVATLIKSIGDFDLAEECAQEAFAAAVDQWRESVPEVP